MLDRRKFLRAAMWVAAAPVIVRASSLMPVRALPIEYRVQEFITDQAIWWTTSSAGDFVKFSDVYANLPPQWPELFSA